ncbi:MAG TPA: hypothetical protein VEA59_00225 [Patescibacteria group bacterium]|nr:hypothetical protein [Patescibacteria group bacterium]
MINLMHKNTYKPLIFKLSELKNFLEFKKFRAQNPQIVYKDVINQQLSEFRGLHPTEAASTLSRISKTQDLERYGSWIVFHHVNTAVHILPKPEFYSLRTFGMHKKTIAIVGTQGILAETLTQLGFDTFLLWDNKLLPQSSPEALGNNGEYGSLVSAQKIFSINPYAQVSAFNQPLQPPTAKLLFNRADFVVDHTNDLTMGSLLRGEAKTRRIPLLSSFPTSLGVAVDVERYDLNNKLEPYLGMIKNATYKNVKHLSFKESSTLLQASRTSKSFWNDSESRILSLETPHLASVILARMIAALANGHLLKSNRYWFDIDTYLGFRG